jgi:hypothetical protein
MNFFMTRPLYTVESLVIEHLPEAPGDPLISFNTYPNRTTSLTA